jgi:hypothetical protein
MEDLKENVPTGNSCNNFFGSTSPDLEGRFFPDKGERCAK